jgi:hypothetical protein
VTALEFDELMVSELLLEREMEVPHRPALFPVIIVI